jgi:hypothetical protein
MVTAERFSETNITRAITNHMKESPNGQETAHVH